MCPTGRECCPTRSQACFFFFGSFVLFVGFFFMREPAPEIIFVLPPIVLPARQQRSGHYYMRSLTAGALYLWPGACSRADFSKHNPLRAASGPAAAYTRCRVATESRVAKRLWQATPRTTSFARPRAAAWR